MVLRESVDLRSHLIDELDLSRGSGLAGLVALRNDAVLTTEVDAVTGPMCSSETTAVGGTLYHPHQTNYSLVYAVLLSTDLCGVANRRKANTIITSPMADCC